MSDKPENPQAFPIQGLANLPNDQFVWPEPGMTLLDWFAGLALQGRLAAEPQQLAEDETAFCNSYLCMAKEAYGLATAMLAERAGRKP